MTSFCTLLGSPDSWLHSQKRCIKGRDTLLPLHSCASLPAPTPGGWKVTCKVLPP